MFQLITQYKTQNILSWTDLFIILMSIYIAEKKEKKEKAKRFLKYMNDIRLASQRYLGWLTYNEQNRPIGSTLDWGAVDADL